MLGWVGLGFGIAARVIDGFRLGHKIPVTCPLIFL